MLMYLVSLERHLKNIGCADTTSSLFLSFSVAEVSMARIQEKTAKAIWSYMVFAMSADTLARHCTQDRQTEVSLYWYHQRRSAALSQVRATQHEPPCLPNADSVFHL